MKKHLLLLHIFMLFLCPVVFAQTATIKAYIEEFNKQCPLQQGIYTLNGATFADGSIVFESTVDENAIDFSTISNNEQQFKQNKFKMLAFVEGTIDFLAEMVNSHTGLIYRYTGSSSRASIVITFSADEIRQIINYSKDPIPFLKAETASSNLLMPIKIDEIQTATKTALENNYVVYYITIDEKLFTLEQLKNIATIRKKELLEFCGDPSNPDYVLATACKKARYGIEYRYTGNKTNNTVSIKIEWTEL